MITARARRALEGLAERLQGHLEDWGSNAAPRRPRLGHTADCPDNGRPLPRTGRCRFCRAEALERRPPAVADRAASGVEPLTELRACTRCHRPTDHPSSLCDRCQTPGDDHA